MHARFGIRALLATAFLAISATVGTGCASEVEESDDGSAAASDPSTPVAWSREGDLPSTFQSKILPWFHKKGRFGSFEGAGGVPIRHVRFVVPRAEEKAAIVVFQGRGESYLKYAETVYDLNRRGYSVYLFDHRGQGFSGRMLPDAQKGHADRFMNYVDDAKRFVDTVVRADPHTKLVAFGHSMGGAILTGYAMKYPTEFAGIVLSAPMHKITFPSWAGGEWGAYQVAKLGDPTSYAPQQGPYAPRGENVYSSSKIRYEAFDDLNVQYPATALGGPTNNWIVEAVTADREIRERAGQLVTPTLLIQASEDVKVEASGQDAVCAAAKKCTKLVLEGSKHEMLVEVDAIRDRGLDATVAFYDRLGR